MTTRFPVEWMKRIVDVAVAIRDLERGDENHHVMYVKTVEFGFYGEPMEYRLVAGADDLEVEFVENVHGER